MTSPQERVRIKKKGSWGPQRVPHCATSTCWAAAAFWGVQPCLQGICNLINVPFKIMQDSISAINHLQLARGCLSKVFCQIWHIWTLSDLHPCLWLRADSVQLDFWQPGSKRAIFPPIPCGVLPPGGHRLVEAILPFSFVLVWDPHTFKDASYPNYF